MSDLQQRLALGTRRRREVPATARVAGREDVAADPRAASRQRRLARNVESLNALYSQREDIRGVSTVADFFVESTSWCA